MDAEKRKLKKPSRKDISDIINEFNYAYEGLDFIERENQKNVVSFNDACFALKQHIADETFKGLSIEKLNINRQGLRVSALTSAGISNIFQVKNFQKMDFQRYSGIGAANAELMFQNKNEIVSQVNQTSKIKISPKDKNQSATNVVRYALKKKKTNDHIKQGSVIKSENQQIHAEAIRDAKKAKSLLRWWLSSKDKRQKRVDSLTMLKDDKRRGFISDAEKLVNEFISQNASTTEEAWKEFERNSAWLYAYVEQGMQVQEEAHAGIPKNLADKINATEIDLRYLKASLRSYQLFGVKYIVCQRNTLLGDDMGLGKTIQALAAICHLSAIGKKHAMVVCPLSVLVNWEREVAKHSELQTHILYGRQQESMFSKWKSEGGVAITTYEAMQKLDLESVKIDMIVVDEAHFVKNPEARRTKALVKKLEHADLTLFMTGTAIENRVEEMIFLLGLLNKEVANQAKSFQFLKDAPEFREKISPVYLRRKRDEVLTELPDKIEMEDWCSMTPSDLESYKQSLAKSLMAIRQVSWNVPTLDKSGKANRLNEILDEARLNEDKVIVFSFFLNTLRRIQEKLGDRCAGMIYGNIPTAERQCIIDDFSAKEGSHVLLCQINTAGVGLNIQSANIIVICEPQFKPSTENQAIARAYRMGQTKGVVVHRLLSVDTIDEAMTNLLKTKIEIFNAFADESELGEISLSDIKSILAIEREKHNVICDDEELDMTGAGE